MKRKFLSLLLVLTLLGGILTGCGVGDKSNGGASNEGEVKVKDTVVYGTPTEPTGIFVPMLTASGSDDDINRMIYLSLLRTAPDGSVEPYLAEKYEIGEDQKSLTYTLRENVKWQDGEPVTVEDVQFTLEALAKSVHDFGDLGPLVGALDFREGKTETIEGVKILDERTIKLEFEKPYGPVLKKLSSNGILPKHIWGEIPMENWEKETKLLQNPIGAGPYKVVKYEPSQYVQLEANENFFGGAPKIKKFIYKVVNLDTLSAELSKGTVDIASVKELRTSEIEELEKSGMKKYSIPDKMYQYVSLNMRRPVFQDKNLRQAIMYAIDRKSIIENILEGRGMLVDGPFLPTGWAAPGKDELNHYDYNKEKSIELLEASGWTDKDGDGVRENDKGDRLSFTLRCSNDSKTRENAVLYVKEALKEVGIEIEVSIEEDGFIVEDCIYNHNFDMYALNCYFGDDPDITSWWYSAEAFDEPGHPSWNFGGYKNEITDEFIEKSSATMDEAERKEYLLGAAKQINEDAPMIFLYVQDCDLMTNGKLEGFNPYTFNYFYEVEKWEYAK